MRTTCLYGHTLADAIPKPSGGVICRTCRRRWRAVAGLTEDETTTRRATVRKEPRFKLPDYSALPIGAGVMRPLP